MKFHIKVDSKDIQIKTNLESLRRDEADLYYQGFKPALAEQILNSFCLNTIDSFLNDGDFDNFFFFIHDRNNHAVVIYNDHFGSNQIYYTKKSESFFISDSVHDLPVDYTQINKLAIYELIVFQGILPPETTFSQVSCLPAASSLSVCARELSVSKYWNIEEVLRNKEQNYDVLVEQGRKAMKLSLKQGLGKRTAVALSGGIDSGGLLGMLKHASGVEKPLAISIGGRGPKTEDLSSARKTAAFNDAEHYEVYPEFSDLKDIWPLMKGLSQPMAAAAAFAMYLIDSRVGKEGGDVVVYGFGAEMILGNLKISKVAQKLRFEQFIPDWFLVPVYKVFVPLFVRSKTRQLFLTRGKDWIERFMVVRAAHFAWERGYFTKDTDGFWNHVKDKIGKQFRPNLDLYDAIVMLYVGSWVNYLQYRGVSSVSKNTRPLMPFDSKRVAEVFFRAPVQHRSKNNWNKQLIRDIMKPYVSDHLYSNPVRSLIVPYAEWLVPRKEGIIDYLAGSYVLNDLLNFESMRDHLENEPEPGYFLLFLIGIAVWYDANFAPERKSEFDRIFK